MKIIVTAAYSDLEEEYDAMGRLLPEHALTSALDPKAPVLCVTSRDTVTGALLDQVPGVRLIATRSTGFEHIDLVAARGVP